MRKVDTYKKINKLGLWFVCMEHPDDVSGSSATVVGGTGGVYRRTISRYDSHYAWLLKERFQKKGQCLEE